MSMTLYAKVTAVLFLVLFVGHLLRLIYGWSLQIAGVDIPMWPSWVAMIVAGFLSAFGFRHAKKK